ncbi:hypothetical protein FRC08_005985 [Ceratobasidium sp. 394]|nr:hypothetical protein FRC08_005985 [Ceratobasidium sp. 394]
MTNAGLYNQGVPSFTRRSLYLSPPAMASSVHPSMVDFDLEPIVPSQVNRYTTDLPNYWSSESAATSIISSGNHIVHPEGSLIYWENTLVSSQPITSTHQFLYAHVLGRLDGAIAQEDVTVFIEIRDHSRAGYYVIVHDSKTIAWVDQHLSESFADVAPTKHHHEYWIHMENFPGPHFASSEVRQNLMNVMASLAIDAATSDGSTSPMSPEQIQRHLQMLNSFGGDMDQHQTYAIARLWNVILQSRIVNYYATPGARLDRFADVYSRPPRFTGPHDTIDKLMFCIPRAHLSRCSRVWADRIAYVEEWRSFKAANEQEWQRMMHSAGVAVLLVFCFLIATGLILTRLWLSSASILASNGSTRNFGAMSNMALLAGLGSLASTHYLLHESRNLGDYAGHAVAYFQAREERLDGLQKVAIINAIPQALLAWSFVFLLAAVTV